MKTLHFFTEFYYPSTNSTSFYITKIIQACAESWQGAVNVFCATQKPTCEILTNKNAHITRLYDGGLSKNHLTSRLLKFFLITLKFSFAALVKVKKGDKVFAVTNPAFMLLFLALLRKVRHFQFVLLVYDIFPEVLIPAGLSEKESIKYRLTLKLFNWAYNSTDKLIVIGRDMKEVVEKKIKDPSKITIVSNWSDTDHISYISKEENPILKRLEVEKKFILSIAGNMGRTQGLDNILNALSLGGFNDQTVFLFMGGGAKSNELKEKVRQMNLKNTFVTGWIPDEEQNAMLNACDVAVISLAEGMYGLSVPSKSYFNMAAGKPLLLIADKRSEIARVIIENNIGWIVPPNNPKELANAIKDIERMPAEELRKLGANAQKTAESLFSEKQILSQFVSCICT